MADINLSQYGITAQLKLFTTLLMNFYLKRKQKLVLKDMKSAKLLNLVLLTL